MILEWLRPGWLAALPAGLALLWLWWRARAGAGPWRYQVDPELFARLGGRASAASARLALGAAAAAIALASLALAGPSWRAEPAPLYRDLSARIVVLDLSRSMDAIDVVPSRIERARAAIVAILRESGDAQLGLVVFGADAFTVAPLMSDAGALVHLLANLGTSIVPRAGSRPDLGLEMARRLLERANAAAGDVILVGDSAGDARALDAARALKKAGYALSVLGVGTPHGGPVRLASGAFAKSETGEILVTRPDFAGLERLAQAGGGRFHALSRQGQPPRFARAGQDWAAAPGAAGRSGGLPQDDGAWLALLALPFAALLFRRGWLATFVVAIALPPQEALAFEWADLWRRADQQAAAAFAEERKDHAPLLAKIGAGSPWHAVLLYRSGRYAEAAAQFASKDSADAHYNRGNALALDGRLEDALAAYNAALERSPSMRDALFNRALVREALAKRRQEEQWSGESPSPRREYLPSPAAPREQSAKAGRDAQAGKAPRAQRAAKALDGGGAQALPEPAQAEAQAEGAAQAPDEALAAAELKRLEGLLARVPDDPGSLLANRFAQQLRRRVPLHHDFGGRW